MFKSCGAKVFSLRIYLSLWYLPAAAVLILFCNMDIVLISFKVWLSWKCFESSLLLACFWCCSNVWRSALKVAALYIWYIRACASNIVQGHLFPFPCSFQYLLFFSVMFNCHQWWVWLYSFAGKGCIFLKFLRWNEAADLQYRSSKYDLKRIYFFGRWQ